MRARIFCMVLLPALVAFDTQSRFIDKGACPGEGCRYGETWIARFPVSLRAQPSVESPVVATLETGSEAITLGGEVHTTPSRFKVTRAHGAFQPGDDVWVYTYLGEGYFRVLHNGELKEADLGFSPWGGTAGTKCEASSLCWGTLESRLEFDWWVQLKGPDEVAGWTTETSQFRPAHVPRIGP